MKNLLIGRSNECNIVINDQYVSRKHCHLKIYDNGKCSIADLGSKTGTFVNGRKIAGEYFLNDHDQVKIGVTVLPWRQYVNDATISRRGDENMDKSQQVKFKTKGFNSKNLKWIIGSLATLLILGLVAYFMFLYHPLTMFDKSYAIGDYTEATAIAQTTDDGYIFGGDAKDIINASSYEYDYYSYISKIDKEGKKLWTKKLYKSEDSGDILHLVAIKKIDNGGYIVLGTKIDVDDGDKEYNGKIIKIDENGEIIWEKTFGSGDRAVWMWDIIQTKDGGFLTSGIKVVDHDVKLWLYKVDADGNKEKEKTFGSEVEDDYPGRIKQTSDEGYILVATTSSKGKGSNDIWLVRLDNELDKIWNTTYGGRNNDYGTDVLEVDGGFVVVGTTSSRAKGYQDVWVLKTDSDGKKEWAKKLGGKHRDSAVGILHDGDGYIIGANTNSEGEGETDGWVIKIDSEGNNTLWDRTYGGEQDDRFTNMIRTSDGGMAFIGVTKSKNEGEQEAWVLKLDDKGKFRKK